MSFQKSCMYLIMYDITISQCLLLPRNFVRTKNLKSLNLTWFRTKTSSLEMKMKWLSELPSAFSIGVGHPSIWQGASSLGVSVLHYVNSFSLLHAQLLIEQHVNLLSLVYFGAANWKASLWNYPWIICGKSHYWYFGNMYKPPNMYL